MKISIKLKVSLFLAILLLLTVSILSILVLDGIAKNQKSEYEAYLAQQVKIANTYIKQIYLTEGIKDSNELLKQNTQKLAANLNAINGMYIAIYDTTGKELFNSLPYITRKDEQKLLSYVLENKIAYELGTDYVNYMAPLYNEGQIGAINFHYSLKGDIEFYNAIRTLFIKIGTIVFIFSFICAYIYTNNFTGSIIELKKYTRFIKIGLYNNITPLKRNDELGELSQDIYYMSNKIKENIAKMEDEQEKLKFLVQKLKILEKQQKNFIGNITHEFKTPLTVIKTYLDLLDMYSDDQKLLNDAKINISKETQRLYEMVEKTLHLSSLQKYNFEFNCEDVNIIEILEDVCNRMKGKAQKFGITITKNLEDSFIQGDKENLMYIFVNLIDNAIKYNNPDGQIFVKNYKKDNRIFIEVSDTGIGIPKEEKEKIFEPFYTVDKNRSRDSGGTGLGLSLVKELVEKQNGDIVLLDTPKKQTTFLMSFPCLEKVYSFETIRDTSEKTI